MLVLGLALVVCLGLLHVALVLGLGAVIFLVVLAKVTGCLDAPPENKKKRCASMMIPSTTKRPISKFMVSEKAREKYGGSILCLCLSVYLFICLSVRLSVCLFLCLLRCVDEQTNGRGSSAEMR